MKQQLPPEIVGLKMAFDAIEKAMFGPASRALLGESQPNIDPKADLVTVTTYRDRKTKQLTVKDDPQGYVLDLLVECRDGAEVEIGEAFVAHRGGESFGFKQGQVIELWHDEIAQAKRKYLNGEITVYAGEAK